MTIATFVTAASPLVGGGHVLRCLALAESLTAIGVRARFVTDRETLNTIPAIADSTFEVVETILADAPQHPGVRGTDVVVFDSYAIERSTEAAWGSVARLRVVIDDLANRPHVCEVLVDHGVGRQARDYEGLVPPNCIVLAGPTYGLLRREFRVARCEALGRRGPRLPKRVLIAMGLTDIEGVTRRVVEGVLLADLGLAMEVVTGRTASSLPWLRRQAETGTLHLHVDIGAPAMAQLMVDADMAVGSGGGTSLERCCMGLPSLVILVANNQNSNVSAQVQAGAVSLIGSLVEASPQRIAAAIQDFALDSEAMAARAHAAATMVDGQGADRVARVLVSRLPASR